MNFLLDPNVAYLVLLVGVLMGFLALVTPGTGLFEIGALFCMVMVGYAVYKLSFNWWSLLLLASSVIPFIYSIQKPKRELFLGLSLFLLIVGSVFMFPNEQSFFAVNPFLALLASTIIVGFLWLSVRKSMEAAQLALPHDPERVVGQLGEAKTNIHEDGSVYVAGELWSARSEIPISAGSKIKVVSRDGFVVVVNKLTSFDS